MVFRVHVTSGQNKSPIEGPMSQIADIGPFSLGTKQIKMKYELREQPDGSHVLYRHGELCDRLPNNIELEFWLEIEELRDKLVEVGKVLGEMPNDTPDRHEETL